MGTAAIPVSLAVLLALAVLPLLAALAATHRARRRAVAVPPAARDHLTGLPDRSSLHSEGDRVFALAAATGRFAVCLVIDLDSFKRINDSLGHHAGDQVLVETARRLESTLRPGDVAVRLGGDEFVVLAACHGGGAAERLAQRLLDALAPSFHIDDLDICVHASTGIAVQGQAGDSLEELLRAADQAMYRAKAQGPGDWQRSGATQLMAAPVDEAGTRRPEAPHDLRGALAEALELEQLEVHYQPQVESTHGAVTGFEALLRWHHPELGLLPPDDFLPLAEQGGLTARINSFVIDRILADHPRLTALAPGATVAVNMSARSLLGVDFVESLAARLAAAGVPPHDLVLEIIESSTSRGPRAFELFAQLRSLGCLVSVQEFGTAEASLTSLWHNPAVREIKVHPTIVRAVLLDRSSERLVHAMVSAAHGLNVRVVAEGVESRAIAERMALLGADILQGFWIGRPLVLDEVAAWSARWQGFGKDRGVAYSLEAVVPIPPLTDHPSPGVA